MKATESSQQPAKRRDRPRSSSPPSGDTPSPDDGQHDEAGAKVPIRDFREDGWYRIENELLDPELFPELAPYDIAVYNALAYHVASEKDGCFPSRQTIADHARCSYGKVWDCIQKLCRLGLVRKRERSTDDGRQTSHEYHLLSVKDLVRAESGEASQHDGGTRHDMTGEASQHDDEQEPSNNTQLTKSSTAANAREDDDEGETSGGLTEGQKSHFDWLEQVGDEDKRQTVYRAADALLRECPPSCLRDSSLREVCRMIVGVTYGEDALSRLDDGQERMVLDVLEQLYQDGEWSRSGEAWSEPVAACAIANVLGTDLLRVGQIPKAWKSYANGSPTGGGGGSSYQGDGQPSTGSAVETAHGSGNSSKPASWETGDQGYPASLEATKQWAEAHDFSELLAKGLWVACGQYGWTDDTSRPNGRAVTGGDPIRNLEAFARSHSKRLMGIANRQARSTGRVVPEEEDVTAEEAGVEKYIDDSNDNAQEHSDHTLEDIGMEHMVNDSSDNSAFENLGNG